MKRIVVLFFVLVLIVASAGHASAEGETPAFVISEAEAAPGEEVKVTISLANNPGIASVELDIRYDHNVLELTNIADNTATYPGLWTNKAENDSFTYWAQGGRNNAQNGVIVTLTFTVKESAVSGDYAVTVVYDEENVYDENEENVAFAVIPGKVAVTANAADGPAFMTQSLLLEGDIGVRFYVRLPEALHNANTSVSFTIGGKDGAQSAATVPFSENLPKNSAGCYGFTFCVNPAQMADTITATLHYTESGRAKTVEKTYAVVDYFEAFDRAYAAHPEAYADKTVSIVRATADLGHYVQAYLDEFSSDWSVPEDHKAIRKAYATYTEKDFSEAASAAKEHAFTLSGGCADVKGLSYKLDFESKSSICLIVTVNDGFSGTLTAAVYGKPCAVTRQTDTKYTIVIPNVKAHQLSSRLEVAITTESGTLLLTGSGLSCVGTMLTGAESNAVMRDAAVALYRYSKAADAVKVSGK